MLARLWTVLSRLVGFFRRDALDREFLEELESHLAMAEEEKIRQGFSPREARRLARIELGGLTQLREAGREARGLPFLDTFWLDFKLSLRMLRKSWGLTLVGGLAMTLAMSVGVLAFWIIQMFFYPALPLAEGHRVIAIQTWDDQQKERVPTAWLDFERWRSSLRSVEDLGAFQSSLRYLEVGEGAVAEIMVAEISASGFELARVAPLLGRPILPGDEAPDAEPVLVIGHDVWQSRFQGDPEILGRPLRLGGVFHTVVGVMPEGFAFPVSHDYWTALQRDSSRLPEETLTDGGEGGAIFARLAAGFTAGGAQAELLGQGLLSPAAKEANRDLMPRVVDYTFAFTGDFEPGKTPWVARIVLMLVSLLLVPPCANIAILVYARTITRQEEFASRFALGASRGRLVGQIFFEVLVLAMVAAVAALVLVGAAGRYLHRHALERGEGGMPFWVDFSLSPSTLLFAAGLAFFAAAIAGLIPALQATGRRMQSGFRALGSGTGLRLGATWTTLVVLQVALTLAALPSAAEMGWGTVRSGVLGPGFAAEEYLTAELQLDGESLLRSGAMAEAAEVEARFAATRERLARSLAERPEITGVTFSSASPGSAPWALVDVEGVELERQTILENRDVVRYNHVDQAFFDVFDVPVLMGRVFEAGDFVSGARAMVVNQTFADLLLQGENPLGQRVRYTRSIESSSEGAAGGPPLGNWYEIVGVVADRPANGSHGTVYHPWPEGHGSAASLGLRVAVQPADALAESLREISRAVDPALRLEEVVTLAEIYRRKQVGNNVGASTLAIVTLSVLLLSAAGIYALMSFTVNQRRREIGIRSALGAAPSRLLWGIFRKAMLQIGGGAALGAGIATFIDRLIPIEQAGGWEIPFIIPGAALFMAGVGLLATAGPARRGMRVDPLEELREG